MIRNVLLWNVDSGRYVKYGVKGYPLIKIDPFFISNFFVYTSVCVLEQSNLNDQYGRERRTPVPRGISLVFMVGPHVLGALSP